MAKITKSAVIELAKKAARSNAQITDLTASQLEAMSWSDRASLASRLSFETTAIDSPHLGDAKTAFENEAQNIWSGKLQKLKVAREAWLRAARGTTTEQARDEVIGVLRSMNIRGARVSGDRFEVTRGRSQATLYVRFEADYDKRIENPDDASTSAMRVTGSVSMSLHVSSESLSRAEVDMAVTREVMNAAHEVQTLLDEMRIYRVYGRPENESMPSKANPFRLYSVMCFDRATADGLAIVERARHGLDADALKALVNEWASMYAVAGAGDPDSRDALWHAITNVTRVVVA